MGIPCEKGNEITALDAALHVMSKSPKELVKPASGQDGASVANDAQVTELFEGGAA